MRLLITRPEADAMALAARLKAMGHEVLSQPLLEIRYDDDKPIDFDGAQAILITSANGARALARRSMDSEILRLPVLAVGPASAAAASDAGFLTISTGGGDASALATLARQTLDPAGGRLIHVAGTVVAGNIKGALEADGFEVDRVVLYEAVTAEDLSENVLSALKEERLNGVLLFSRRTARTFASLLRDGGLEETVSSLTAWCLAPAVADALEGLPFKETRVAPMPTEDALLTTLS